jgi:hypothetical protein
MRSEWMWRKEVPEDTSLVSVAKQVYAGKVRRKREGNCSLRDQHTGMQILQQKLLLTVACYLPQS